MISVSDLTGKRFGKLTVIDRYPYEGKNSKWNCICECGTKTIVDRPNLISNTTQSCGCIVNIYKSNMHLKKIFTNLPKSKNGCWEWNKSVSHDGYGRIFYPRRNEKMIFIHRLSYELFIGPIPKDKFVCHSCDNPKCVNPDHLWLGTHKDNQLDALKKGRHTTQIYKRTTNQKLIKRK